MMKKSLLMISAALTLLVSSCRSDSTDDTASIIGNWRVTKISIQSGTNNAALATLTDACTTKSTFTFQDGGVLKERSYQLEPDGTCYDGGNDQYSYTFDKSKMLIYIDAGPGTDDDVTVKVVKLTASELVISIQDDDENNDGVNDIETMTAVRVQ